MLYLATISFITYFPSPSVVNRKLNSSIDKRTVFNPAHLRVPVSLDCAYLYPLQYLFKLTYFVCTSDVN